MNIAPSPRSRFMSDRAVTADRDRLGFGPYATTLANIILRLRPMEDTPLTVGIFGSWGSGKTTLMGMVASEIERRTGPNADPTDVANNTVGEVGTVWFNAWQYSREDVLWRALMIQVLAGVDRYLGGSLRAEMSDLHEWLYRATGPSELGRLSVTAGDLRQDPSRATITMALQQGVDLLAAMPAAPKQRRRRAAAAATAEAETDTQDGAGAPTVGDVKAAQALYHSVLEATSRADRQRVQSLDEVQTKFRTLVAAHVENRGMLVVMVDDLDRCLPEKAVEALEAIKLFLDAPGCVFVLGIDREVVERGIRIRYGELGGHRMPAGSSFLLSGSDVQEGQAARYRAFLSDLARNEDDDTIDGGRYLEKIIQIPFTLPPISPRMMGDYINELDAGLPSRECATSFAVGLEPNPRQVKRAINIFTLLWELAQNNTLLQITPVRLAKLVVLQQRHPAIYDLLRERPELLIWLEAEVREVADPGVTALLPPRDKIPPPPDRYEPAATGSAPSKNRGGTGSPVVSRNDRRAALEELAGGAERFRALTALLTLHPLEGELAIDANFVDLPWEDAAMYVFLARSVKESVDTPTLKYGPDAEPRAEDRAAEEAPAGGVVAIQSELSETILGSVLAGARKDLEPLAELPATGEPLPEDARRYALEVLAAAGGRLYGQIARDPKREAELRQALQGADVLEPSSARGEANLPWEVIYAPVSSGDATSPPPQAQSTALPLGVEQTAVAPDPAAFWGLRFVVARTLPRRLAKQSGPDQDTEDPGFRDQVEIVDVPRVLVCGVPNDEASADPGLTQWLDGEARDGRIQMAVATGGDLFRALADHQAHLLLWHGAASVGGDGILLPMQDRPLTLRELQSVGRSSRPERGVPLVCFHVTAGIASEPMWSDWLELLGDALQAGGIVAPTARVDLRWSSPFFQRFLAGFLAGQPAGESLRDARASFLADDGDPRGLLFAYFGAANLRLARQEAQSAA